VSIRGLRVFRGRSSLNLCCRKFATLDQFSNSCEVAGENAVLRLLTDRSGSDYTLEALGMSADDCAKIERALGRGNGMILSTGPTGSGKTTTLYTLIKMLNSSRVSIVTIEDPIEYSIEGI